MLPLSKCLVFTVYAPNCVKLFQNSDLNSMVLHVDMAALPPNKLNAYIDWTVLVTS